VIHQDSGKLQVTPAVAVRAGTLMRVRVNYAGVPSAIPNRHCGTSPWLRTADGAVAVGEPDITPWWYPCNDHPLDKAAFTITAVAPAGLQVISNGALLGDPEPAGPGWQRWRWAHGEPMAPYLAFVAIGHYDILRRETALGPYLAAPAGHRGCPCLGGADTPDSRGFCPGFSVPTPLNSSAGWFPTLPPSAPR
jgi:aminopeptidase N